MPRRERSASLGGEQMVYSLEPIRSPSLADSVLAQLRRVIINGDLSPGERLVETDLAEQLEVSRATIRQALLQLRFEGLVEMRPRRGAVVTRMSSDAAGQVCTVRGLLEGWAARTACLQLTEDQLATMRSMSREMGESVRQGNVYEVMEIDIAFHTLICRCSDNDYLFDRWQSLNALHGALLASRLAYYNYDHVGIVRRHEELCETLACRDADAAEAAIRSHYIGAFLENAADSVAVIGLPSPPFRQEKISEGA